MRVTTSPFELPLEPLDGAGNGGIEYVYNAAPFTSDVHDVRAYRADPQNTLICRLAPAAGVEAGPVEDHLPTVKPDHPSFKLFEIGVLEKQVLGHSGRSGRASRSRSLKVTTS